MSQGLGEALVQQGVLTAEQHAHAEQQRAQTGAPLGRTLIELGFVQESDIVRAVAAQMGLPFADMNPAAVDATAAGLIPRDVAREIVALPVQFAENNTVVVALADPGNSAALSRVAEITGLGAHPALAVRGDLMEAIEHLADASGNSTISLASVEQAPAAPAAPVSAPPQQSGGFKMPGTDDEKKPGLLAGGAQTLQTAANDEKLAYEKEMMFDLDGALQELLARGGSDLHLTCGIPPAIRVHGELTHLKQFAKLEPESLRDALYAIMNQRQRETFENDLELDMSYSIPNVARFRVNVFQQREAIGSVMRVIPFEIKPLEDLGVPKQVANFAFNPRGLVLVTGPTGSGKSTTLASLIDIINRETAKHIITVEDPIEFLHNHKKSVVNQRELGQDTHSFAQALKHVLRQDPDVILVGEMRDLETIQLAITAAETGHLVFGTLHTQDAPQTIDRVIDVFPPHQQEQIRVMLSTALNGVVTQQLLKTADGNGRCVAVEIMVATSAIKNLIREGKTHQMYSSIQAGKDQGMVSMDQSLAELVRRGKVTYQHALEQCANVPEFNRLCGRG